MAGHEQEFLRLFRSLSGTAFLNFLLFFNYLARSLYRDDVLVKSFNKDLTKTLSKRTHWVCNEIPPFYVMQLLIHHVLILVNICTEPLCQYNIHILYILISDRLWCFIHGVVWRHHISQLPVWIWQRRILHLPRYRRDRRGENITVTSLTWTQVRLNYRPLELFVQQCVQANNQSLQAYSISQGTRAWVWYALFCFCCYHN